VSFLLDTNVISEMRKRYPNHSVQAWFESVAVRDLYLSAMVVGEIRQGIERLRHRDPVQAGRIEAWLMEIREAFRERMVQVTPDIADVWGRLNAARTLSFVDGLLAATSLTLDLTLVTRNTRDVAGIGVRLLNPFEPAT
jgi:toxin FitB